MKKKNKFLIASLAVSLLITLGIAGCGTSKNGSSNNSNGIITISVDTGATNQFIRAFNGPTVNMGVLGLFFEPLYDFDNNFQKVPRLASGPDTISYKPFKKSELKQFYKDLAQDVKTREKNGDFKNKAMKDSYIAVKKRTVAKGIEVHDIPIKSGIKWSDGVPFTAKDVAFTFQNNYYYWGMCGEIYNCLMNDVPKAINDTTVETTFNGINLNYTFDQFNIKPEHIYNKTPLANETNGNSTQTIQVHDFSKFADKDPVGTGPGKILSFTGTKIKIAWRDDYWGGKTNGVKEMDFIPAGAAAKTQSDITKGVSDWAEGSVNDVQTIFVNKSPDNHYKYFPNGNARDIMFNVDLPPVNDVAVRKALRDSVDLTEPQKAVNIGYPIPSVTGVGVANSSWAQWIDPEYAKPMTPNVDQAKQELQDAGWSINSNGNLEKDGKEYPLTLWTSTTEKPEDSVIMPILKKQWQENLGLNVKYIPTADTPFNAGKSNGKYQMWTDNGERGGSGSTSLFYLYGWDVASTSDFNLTHFLLDTAGNKAVQDIKFIPTKDYEKIKHLNQVASKSIVEGAPYIPYEELGTGVMWSTKHWINWPDNVNTTYAPTIVNNNRHGFIFAVKQLKPA